MKKAIVSLLIFLGLVGVVCTCSVYAQGNATSNELNRQTTGKLIEIKEKAMNEMSDYNESYGSEAYGFTAYMLNKVRVYSIPLCFIGIAVGAIWQYVIGIRKMDVHDRGLMMIVTFITILVICQVLPLIFAIVVKGFRS